MQRGLGLTVKAVPALLYTIGRGPLGVLRRSLQAKQPYIDDIHSLQGRVVRLRAVGTNDLALQGPTGGYQHLAQGVVACAPVPVRP